MSDWPGPPARHDELIECSRRELLAEIDMATDLVLVRGPGNVGDDLIAAGTRALLGQRIYAELSLEQIGSVSAQTALILGGGAFSRVYHEYLPRALTLAEQLYERVIVLPSTFETETDAVRDALARSSALVFARERESLRRISGLCDARLAHDCAFYFDYRPYAARHGEGVLEAWRTDRESGGGPLPDDNEDISATAPSLEAWLEAIADHSLIRTDRAHVMIAAAMMGRSVEVRPCSYFKLDAIADHSLRGFPITRLPAVGDPVPATLAPLELTGERERTRRRVRDAAGQAAAGGRAAIAPGTSNGTPRVTAVVVTRDRPDAAIGAVHALLHDGGCPLRVIVIANGSSRRTGAALEQALGSRPEVVLRRSDRNLGCAGGRALGAALADTELVLAIHDDAEVMPGAVARMVAELDAHPDAVAVGALVVAPDATVRHLGGHMRDDGRTLEIAYAGAGLDCEDGRLPATGPTGWIPGTAALYRAEALSRHAPAGEPEVGIGGYEDIDWSLRVAREQQGAFRACAEAIVMHHSDSVEPGLDFAGRAWRIDRVMAHAALLRRHGVMLDAQLAALMPELRRTNGRLDRDAARLLLELVAARGSDWALARWLDGGLRPLLDVEPDGELADAELEWHRHALAEAHAVLHVAKGERDLAQERLQRIYGSRLWKLGGLYDRNRTRARRLLGLLERRP